MEQEQDALETVDAAKANCPFLSITVYPCRTRIKTHTETLQYEY